MSDIYFCINFCTSIFVTIPRGFIFLLFNWFHQKLIRVSTLQNKEFIIQKMDLETPDSYAPTILWFYSWFICGKYSCAFNWDYQQSSWSKFTFRQVLLPLKIRLQDHPHCGVVCRPHRTVRQWIALQNTNPTIRKSWFTSKMFEKFCYQQFKISNHPSMSFSDIDGWFEILNCWYTVFLCGAIISTRLKNGPMSGWRAGGFVLGSCFSS